MLCGEGDIGNYYYGQGHPMKPQRIRMCHNLLLNYGLYRKMEIYVSSDWVFMSCDWWTLQSVKNISQKSLVVLWYCWVSH